MEAYAILDGGGIKGAALAGCLKAAEDADIKFIGYGGTSAGSIVALLASIGYSGSDLRKVLTEDLQFSTLLAGVRPRLTAIAEIREQLRDPGLKTYWRLKKYKPMLQDLFTNFGFENGSALKQKILDLVRGKLKDIGEYFTFQDLEQSGCKPLKIVASDLGGRKPTIFSNSGDDEQNGAVLDAIRASMSYPFIFTPVKFNDRYLVDGGLCSNLPIFLFDKERRQNKRPLLAFDLVTTAPDRKGQYNLGDFCSDMLDTALEAGDFLMRRATSSSIYHVRVTVPEGMGTLDFDLPKKDLEGLFDRGVAEAHDFFSRELKPWIQARNLVERLQTLHAPPADVKFILEQFASQMERETGMTSVRAHVMLPTGDGSRIVVYQCRMDNDPDQELKLAENAGATGHCWITREPTIADLEDAAKHDNFQRKWKMTPQQQAAVRKDRKAMICVPIFLPQTVGDRHPHNQQELIGILSADTDRSLRDMMWFTEGSVLSEKGRSAALIAACWSATLSWVLR